MRIISKVRDYYDSGAAWGIDTTLVYDRRPVIVNPNDHLYKDASNHVSHFSVTPWAGYQLVYKNRDGNRINLPFKYQSVQFVVAGKVFFPVAVYPANDVTKAQYFYSNKSLYEYISTLLPKDVAIEDVTMYSSGLYQNKFQDESTYVTEVSDSLREFMLDNRIVSITPCVEVYSNSIVFNTDNLKQFQIQREVDAMTMFHNIDQWISMTNDPSRRMVEISDKDKLVKHGMDATSFRKAPALKVAKK